MIIQPYADDLPYFKTSKMASDSWIDKAKVEIVRAKGQVETEAFASGDGKEAFLLGFSFGEDRFTIHWPVLKPRDIKDAKAAKVQAATMLYHDVKSRCISARVMGVRSAFMGYLLMANGQTADQVSNAEYMLLVPRMIMLGDGK